MSVEMSGVVIDETLVTTGTVNTLTETLVAETTPSLYKSRMMDYYPQVIQSIAEFKAIVDSECPEFETLDYHRDSVLDDAYLHTMCEHRIKQWEQILGIKPIADSTIDDRRNTIIARIRGQGKLNTALINSIVNAFTGGAANSWVEDGVLYVEITPPKNNKSYQFANVEQELAKKVPAHLGLQVSRNYYEWSRVNTKFATWGDVLNFGTWEDIYLLTPSSPQQYFDKLGDFKLGYSTL